MAVVCFIAAIVCAFTGYWWLCPFLIVAAVVIAADTIERDRHKRLSQLRMRQLDRLSREYQERTFDRGDR
jgi:hypothetical protein